MIDIKPPARAGIYKDAMSKIGFILDGHATCGPGQPAVESLLQLSPEEADALPYGLIVLDPTGVVIGYNAAESRLSGLAAGAVIGRNFFLDIAPCTRVRAFAGLYRQMVDTGEPAVAQFDFVFRFSYGETRVSVLMTYSREARRGTIVVEQRPDVPASS